MDPKTEYQWLEMVVSDSTIDSPFWPSLGGLTRLLSEETDRLEKARHQKQEIVTRRIPINGTSRVRMESMHPTEDVIDILVQLNSQASEGIACALIITLANDLRSLSKLFGVGRSDLKVCAVGPLIGGARWADLVAASSNYVRHGEEWAEASSSGKEPTDQQKKSVEPLIKSGLDVWDDNPSLLDVAKHLKIEQWDTLFRNLSDWLSSCLPSHPRFSSEALK